MGKIPNVNEYNFNRQELLKIKNKSDETILFTKEEAKEALISYITDELELFSSRITTNTKVELQQRVDFKLRLMENELVRLINDKVDKITERVVTLITTRVIDEEVNKQLEEKLKKIKDSL